MSVATAFPSLSLDRMVFLSEPEDGTNRLFVALQAGTVVVFPNSGDIGSSQVFLDISGRVTSGGNEQGLLGLAFDPNYKTNGYLFVYYTSASPSRHAVLSRFSVSPSNSSTADPNSELIILQIPQPRGYTNHNGGSVLFGPDGYLYIGIGDGGSEGDPQGNGQNLSTLLGKIIRIDVNDSSKAEPYRIPSDNPFVDNANTRGEIWAYGLRNPWRLSFDQQTGLLWAGDVGQNSFEEVDTIKSGGNYGWNRMEGFHCYPPSLSQCDMSGLELPVTEYDHGQGCAITGGYVYRGSRLPSLYGAYVYADYCSGKIWALRIVGGKVTDHIELVDGPTQISSFGEDVNRELYILSFDGSIYQLEPAV